MRGSVPSVFKNKTGRGQPCRFTHTSSSRKRGSASFNLAGLQALRADIDLLVCTIDLCSDVLDVRLPHMIGSSVGVGYVVPEMSTFTADFTLGHPEHLLIKLHPHV